MFEDATRLQNKAVQLSAENAELRRQLDELLTELSMIVDGWDAIESNKIRRLSDWEKERREFARDAIARIQRSVRK